MFNLEALQVDDRREESTEEGQAGAEGKKTAKTCAAVLDGVSSVNILVWP
jgi:hypothetical protein